MPTATRSPEEQRERYLEAVKRDNQEISAMERRITELQTRTSELDAEMTDLAGSGASGGVGESILQGAAPYVSVRGVGWSSRGGPTTGEGYKPRIVSARAGDRLHTLRPTRHSRGMPHTRGHRETSF